MAVVTMRQLLDAGVHFGHQTRRWNPKMKRFIFTERNGIYIIDLQQTLSYIDRAYEFVKETVAHGGTILFVGTKRQAQEAIAEQATRVNMPYVNQRWLGGMLTNFSTVHKRLQRLKDLEAMETSGEFAGRTKKEVLLLTREKDKLAKTLGGIRDMARVPSAVWVVDTKKEHIAVGEARKLNIPVVAVLDTNCDPDEVDYPVPGNDDAIRSAALLTKVVAEAVAEGLLARSGGAAVAAGEEPLAEWERELLAAGDAAPVDVEAGDRGRRGGADRGGRRRGCRGRPGGRGRAVRRRERLSCLTSRSHLTDQRFTKDTNEKMANYTAADVKKLRELTGAGFMDCKAALEETDGDFDKAIEFLRIKGAKRRRQAGRAHHRRGPGGQQRWRIDRARTPRPTSSPRTPSSRSWERASPRPPRAPTAPSTAPSPPHSATARSARRSRRCRPRSARSWCSTGSPSSTAPSRSTCTVVRPTCRRRSACWSSTPATAMPRPRRPARPPCRSPRSRRSTSPRRRRPRRGAGPRAPHRRGIAREEGKPEAALPKIVEGRVNGFYKAAVLVEQPSVRDSKVTVGKQLEEAGVTVTRFARFEVGTV